MAVGMTAVFAFLGVLVVAMQATAGVLGRFLPAQAEPAPEAERAQATTAAADEDLIQIAIALAAVEAHRRRQGE